MKKKVLILIGALVVAVGAIVFLLLTHKDTASENKPYVTGAVTYGVVNGPEEGATIITLTKDGFVPDEVTISQGTTVVFKNKTGNLFWPASNLHPSHLIYPEFDPQIPISPTDTWSTTFTKVGEWKFHDHLSPYFTGVITVTN